MLGSLGSILQNLAIALTTGTVPLALATIAIMVCGVTWMAGRMHIYTAACVVLGIAIVGAASTIASSFMSG